MNSRARTGRALLTAVIVALAVGTSGVASAGTRAGQPVGGPLLGTQGVVIRGTGATTRLPRLTAASFLLADLTTGDVLAAKNPHGRLRPASTQKILTAITVLPRLDPDTVYRAQWADAKAVGSRVGIVPDATYTVRNLFEGMFLMSGNDAARALAEAAGGVHRTVAAMNLEAQELEAMDTHVVNPSGLDAKGQVSSAYDLALFARAGLARKDFRTYVTTVHSTFPGKMPRRHHRRKTFQIWTQDRLLLNYRGAFGVKTGWTTKAQGTFVGVARRHGHVLLATVMHTTASSWEEDAALLDWGFRNVDTLTPVGTLDRQPAPQAAPIRHTHEAERVVTAAASGATGHGVPWWLWPPLALAAVVAVLRARVVLLRRRRRFSY
ncbi:MAG: hypothetical protein QOE01_2116 [Actinomycetota bacterium]|jgi:D-alanyl-D-alanine carboxypeptidase (penicillin-binding protein 5/6)|nr:hypothetical protein [Actinomycetota bacterium]